jgi:hypothetical protein
MKIHLSVVAIATCSIGFAQVKVTVPNSLENSFGSTWFYPFTQGGSTTTYINIGIPGTQLTNLTGLDITSLRLFRMDSQSTLVDHFTVMAGNQVLRSGSLNISGSDPFLDINFDQTYHYDGGLLQLQLVCDFVNAPQSNGPMFFAANPGTDGIVANVTRISHSPAGDFTTNLPNVNVLQMQFTGVPEPASLAVLGIGAFGLLMRRKKKN